MRQRRERSRQVREQQLITAAKTLTLHGMNEATDR